MKKKNVAAILAFLLGLYGVHRFYLGQKALGVIYFIGAMFGFFLMFEEGVPMFIPVAIIAFIDAILLAVMPQEEFDEKYNKKKSKRLSYQKTKDDYRYEQEEDLGLQSYQVFKSKGIQSYRKYDYETAIKHFNRALRFEPEDPAIHFNLACCHSRLEEAELAFEHLEKAVKFGFDDLDKIHSHDALAYLRTLEDFDLFVENGYELPALNLPDIPSQNEDNWSQKNPEQSPEEDNNLLNQLKELALLRDKGILTDEEYAEQKRRMIDENKRNR